MLQHIVHIGSGLELFQRILVFKDLADIAQQVKMVVADTGNAEHEVGFFITEVHALRILQQDNAGLFNGALLLAGAVGNGYAHAHVGAHQLFALHHGIGVTVIHIAPLCQQAMDLNFDGLIVESHCNPDCAWSDASQQVTPDVLDYILNLLVIRTETQTTESLSQLRKQIDECDDNIIQELAKRMRIAREIGTYKKEHGITVLQAGRYNEILEKRGAQGEQCGMDAEFMKKIFEAIHEESVRQQMEIINK